MAGIAALAIARIRIQKAPQLQFGFWGNITMLPLLVAIILAPPVQTEPAGDSTSLIPLTDPAGWVVREDYPSIALLKLLEGTVVIKYRVSTNGKVKSCSVAESSGHPTLDKVTCQAIRARATYRVPAPDADQQEITRRVTWKIPADVIDNTGLKLESDFTEQGKPRNCRISFDKKSINLTEWECKDLINRRSETALVKSWAITNPYGNNK